ncbi:MAG: hypothetical protein K9H25_23105 [Rhodospirillum sp.]|nr:hypothetical protein [Rhodospirillum sp.]MCF8491383.1 hypothetical protein [Rhodospirillum sp.]MCF8503149.1 hypothetical protein [Rhodospirillum sp.]
MSVPDLKAAALLDLALTAAMVAKGSRAEPVKAAIRRATALAMGRDCKHPGRPDPDAWVALFEKAGGDYSALVAALNRHRFMDLED